MKNVVKKGGAQKTTTAPQKMSLFGEPWRYPCALVLGGFLPPKPPELEKKHGFYRPFQWIRGGPLGDARSRARQSISKAFLRV